MSRMTRLLATLILLALALTACGGGGDTLTVKGKGDETVKLRVTDVWQDEDQKVMVSLQGTGTGKLLDVAAQPTGRYAMPHVKVRVLSGGEWLEPAEYPQGMFSLEDNGTMTARFDATKLPEQLEVGGKALDVAKLKLPGVDRQALLEAEKEVYRKREEAAAQQAEEEQKRRDEAQVVPAKIEPDMHSVDEAAPPSGESLYYCVTGLENADAVVLSFMLSADGKTAHNIRADMYNGVHGNNLYNIDSTLMMNFPVEDGRLFIENDAFLLDVTLEGEKAEGIFGFGVKDGTDVYGRDKYASLGIARVTMEKR